MTTRSGARRLLATAWLVPALAFAQSHQMRQGDFTLRSDTVPSTAIAPGPAERNGIEQGRRQAILNVVVLRGHGRGRRPVSADVQAHARDLAGMRRAIAMHASKTANGDVSYVGTYSYAPREVLDMVVTATPDGSSRPLSLTYRARMPAS